MLLTLGYGSLFTSEPCHEALQVCFIVHLLHDLPRLHAKVRARIETRRVSGFLMFANPVEIDQENTITFMRVKYVRLAKVTKDMVPCVKQLQGLLKSIPDDFGLQRIWDGRRRKEAVKRTGVW